MTGTLGRRDFHRLLLATACGALGSACGGSEDERYTAADAARLEAQKRAERERSGTGPYGPRVVRGYRGLAELPWFELGPGGELRTVARDLPPVFDVHTHLGMSLGLAPDLDLQRRSDRVRHLLDCDAETPGCRLDLDVYMNANFTDADLRALRFEVLRSFTIGGSRAATHTIPNLLAEMDATGVRRAVVLPIAFGLPFGDDLTERWGAAIAASGAGERLIPGASVHPRDPERRVRLRRYAAAGARMVKLHPAAQRFYPDAPEAMEIYAECGRLGLPVFFHGGRAGIEPRSQHRYTLPRGYEPALAQHPEVRFVLGHAGARDWAGMLPLARRYPNCWLGIHGQGVSVLHEILETLGPERLLFGSDWPFYHEAATLAKVLLVTEDDAAARSAILHRNAERLLGLG